MTVGRYAADTEVSVEKSRGQLEALLRQAGATQFHFGWTPTEDIIEFGFRNLQIRFLLPKHDRKAFSHSKGGRVRTPRQIDDAIAQADRQRWRALFLVVRAKLEAVEAGIATFEREFLPFVVTGSNQTVGDILIPRLAAGGPLGLLTDGA